MVFCALQLSCFHLEFLSTSSFVIYFPVDAMSCKWTYLWYRTRINTTKSVFATSWNRKFESDAWQPNSNKQKICDAIVFFILAFAIPNPLLCGWSFSLPSTTPSTLAHTLLHKLRKLCVPKRCVHQRVINTVRVGRFGGYKTTCHYTIMHSKIHICGRNSTT